MLSLVLLLSGSNTNVAGENVQSGDVTIAPYSVEVLASSGSSPSVSSDGSRVAYVSSDAIYVTDIGNLSSRNVSPGFQHSLWPMISGNGQTVAFQSFVDQHFQLYMTSVLNPEAAKLVQFDASINSYVPSITYDGRIVAFHTGPQPCCGPGGTFVVHADGSGLRQIARDSNAEISGDGTMLVYSRGGPGPITLVNLDDGGERILYPSGDDPTISYDGSKIAFVAYESLTSDSEVFVVNSDGTGLRQLTDNDVGDLFPSISGDGKLVAYQTERLNPFGYEIRVVNSDGTGMARIDVDGQTRTIFGTGYSHGHVNFNGSAIVFESNDLGVLLARRLSPGEAVQMLAGDVQSLPIDHGTKASLLGGLFGAKRALTDGKTSNDPLACVYLDTFEVKVKLYVGQGKLTTDETSQLLYLASSIRLALGCK